MANFPFTVGDSLRIGSATISASGNAVVLPTGTQVGNQNVATTVEVSTGGGPKITNLQVTSNVYVVLDDTAVDLTGGFIKITGTNFVSGCMVYVASTPANSTTFVSTTEVRAQLPATAAGTYPVYLVNPDGGTAIRVPGVTFSASPAWQTASSLGEQYDGVVLTLPVVATDATVYTLSSGSLPPGLSLNSNTGVISGTVSGVANDTVYSFTITATDAQLQDSPRTFTVTITVSDPYFKLTTLLLSGSALSANTVVRDSSTNNFNLTVVGDSRASNFTPYGTGWSVYFDGSGDYLQTPNNAAFAPGAGDFTAECWIYSSSATAGSLIMGHITSGGAANTNWAIYKDLPSAGNIGFYASDGTTFQISGIGGGSVNDSRWHHIAVTRSGSSFKVFVDGTQVGSTGTWAGTIASGAYPFKIGYNGTSDYFNGYISNLRVVKGTALYTANFTPATTNLTSVANTSLLTCHANRFLDGSTNNFTITRNGDARVVSFNPFNITNTGVDGSMYFDGTGDYLSAAYNSAFDLGSSNFTLEAWLYTSDSSSNFPSIVGRWQGSGTACWDLRPRSIERGNFLVFVYSTDGTTAAFVDSNGPALSDNAWHHVVAVRSGNNFALFVDGTRRNTANLSGVTIFNSASAPLNVGYDSWGTTYFTGYLSDVRVVKGTAVYDPTQTTLTVPTAPLTNIANTQLLTLQYDQPHNNHTFLDSSSNQFLITRNGNATQGTFSPFSQTGWSNYFDGGDKYLSFAGANTANAMGTGDWTFEAWLYPTTSGTDRSIFDTEAQGAVATALRIRLGTSNQLILYLGGIVASGGNVPANTWTHVAICKSSGSTRLFVNGSQVGSTYSDSNNYTCGVNRPIICVDGYASSTLNFYGFISNLRVVKGQGLFTGTFTPSNLSLGLTTVGSTGPGVPTQNITGTVSLLTCQSNRFIDNSTNNFTITATGSPSVQAFSPFAPTAFYNPAVHGGSAYFDGTGDYLTAAQNTAFNLGTGAFTVEAWINLRALPSPASGGIITLGNGAAGSGPQYCGWGLWVNTTGTIVFERYDGTEVARQTSTTITLNQWNHIVAVRDSSSNFAIFINGVRGYSAASATTSYNNVNSDLLYVGRTISGAGPTTNYLTGYIGDVRVVAGTAVYSATSTTLTVPTAPVTATTNTSLLLNFTDAAILDSTGRQVLETLADAKSSSAITKFTGGSMSFDGTGDYLQSSAPLSELVFLHNGTPWTVEGWFYTGSTSAQYILSTDLASASIGMSIGLSDTNTRDIMAQILRGVSGSWVLAISPTNSWNLNTWTHFAVTFDSSKNLTVYINGVQVATASGSSFAFSTANPSYPLVVGRYQSPTPAGYFNGYISDLRVTRGYARYTGNFTAPTGPARLK